MVRRSAREVTIDVATGLVLLSLATGVTSAQLGAAISEPALVDNLAPLEPAWDLGERIATDGQGRWIVVWGSTASLGDTIGRDWDVLFARSTDNGRSWTDPRPVNNRAALDGFNSGDSDPWIATDGEGRWSVVWKFERTIVVARSDDDGETWSDGQSLVPTGSHYRPKIGCSGGEWVVIWESSSSGDLEIVFRTSSDGGESWSQQAYLNTDWATDDGRKDWFSTLEATPDGSCAVAWSASGSDPEVLVSIGSHGCNAWSDPAFLNSNAGEGDSDFSPALATDDDAVWVATYSSNGTLDGTVGDDLDIMAVRSTDGGLTWSDAVALNTDAGQDSRDDRNGDLVTDGFGNWVATWSGESRPSDPEGADWDLFVARSTDGGLTWSVPQTLNTDALDESHDDYGPIPITDRAVNWITVWNRDPVCCDVGDVYGAWFRLPLADTCVGDGDGDGYGSPGEPSCPLGAERDCDDAEINVYPGGEPLCDGLNNDCSDPTWPALPPDELDVDGDEFPFCADCDDSDGQVWQTPGEVPLLSVQIGPEPPGTVRVTWTPPLEAGGPGVRYDTVRTLDASDFVSVATCLETAGADLETVDDEPLGTGAVAFYLVRAVNACPDGAGPVGEYAPGRQREVRSCP